MELLYFLFVIGFSVFNLGRCEEGLRELLQKESKSLAANVPGNVNNFVSNIRPVTAAFTERLRKEDINKLQGKINNESLQKFKGIIFAKSLAIKSFSFISSHQAFSIQEYIGAAVVDKKDPNYFKLAFIKVDVKADVKQMYERYSERNCGGFLFFRSCRTTTHTRPRSFLASEIQIINQGLKGEAYKQITAKISGVKLLSEMEKFLTEDDENLEFEALKDFNKNQTLLESGNEIFSLDKTKKIVLTRNGQLFIGDADFNNYNDEKRAKNHGDLIGEKKKRTKQGFIMQVTDEGNIVITNGKDYTYLSSNTRNKGVPPYQISVTNDKNFIVYDSQFRPIFDRKGRFKKAVRIIPQGFRLYSENGEFYLMVEPSGRIAIYKDNVGKEEDKMIWENGYSDEVEKEVPPYTLVVERTGKLREVNGKRKTLWKTSKLLKGIPPYNLVVNNDGSLNLVDLRKKVIWKN